MFTKQRHAFFDAFLCGRLRAAEDDGFRILNLIYKEFAKIANVHAAFAHIGNGSAASQAHIVRLRDFINHAADIGELAYAGGLDENAVGMIGIDQLAQGLGKVAHQGAADATGIQLGYLNARILHKAAVNADFAIFIFQQNDLFTLKSAVQKFFDQSRLACAQKTGNNVNLRHFNHLSYSFVLVDANLCLPVSRTSANNIAAAAMPSKAPPLSIKTSRTWQVRPMEKV